MSFRLSSVSTVGLVSVLLSSACATGPTPTAQPAPAPRREAPTVTGEPLLPPAVAMLAGLMPLRSTGVDRFLSAQPESDGRGVLIGILDSGIDAGVPGLEQTTTGAPKLLDLRDFSGEGHVRLSRLPAPVDDRVEVEGIVVAGMGRLTRLAGPPYYGGVFRERPLGEPPASDVDGDGTDEGLFPIVVARASDGWFLMTDTDSDGSLANERPVRDYSVARETFAWGPLTIAANFGEVDGAPRLDLFFDNSGHGTHVAGIAAGHNMFGVAGFDGVAPGVQLLGLKISNNARGGISVTGSMVRAMEYAADYAAQRSMPLVLNLSFGVGNEEVGAAAIDSIIDDFAQRRPDVLFVISAGNDGPGLSTVGFPGSADFALTACALFPGVYASPPMPGQPPPVDVLGWWSSRGGESQKPDLCTPGVAFSNVPPWHTGHEVSGGTSMSAPQASGLAALLQSALLREARPPARAAELKRALMATARPVAGASTIDQGTGVPDAVEALRWLRASHQAGRYRIRALPDGGNTSRASGAYRRSGLSGAGDTLQRFEIQPVGGQPAAVVLLRSDAAWLRAPSSVDFRGGPAVVTLRYDARQIREPGVYVGTVWGRAAGDTIAGAVFGLTNTVVVPRPLDEPFSDRRTVGRGAVARYFFTVPERAGGLTVTFSVENAWDAATLYLFEPNGQPHRGTASIGVGGEDPETAQIEIAAEDIVPGVYEAVVVAPPLTDVHYRLSARLPPVAVGVGVGSEIAVVNRTASRRDVTVRASFAGAERRMQAGGDTDAPVLIPVQVPFWAAEMVVDVEMDRILWPRFTDFGVSVFDAEGRMLGNNPLNYAFGRLTLSLPQAAYERLDVELFPGFAREDGDHSWRAEVRIVFVPDSAVAAAIPEEVRTMSLSGFAARPVTFDDPRQLPVPAGFRSRIAVRASHEGSASLRHVPGPTAP